MYKTGRCLCGGVQYQLEDAPLFVQACHCTLCQRVSGSAFNLIMVIETNKFNVSSGELNIYDFKGGSGATYHIHSCKSCGTSLWGRPKDALKAITYVRSGTLDDTKDIEPLAHIFIKTKQRWLPLPEETPKFEGMYDLEMTWPAESLRRLQAI